jgi:hypothetical protein
MEKLAKMANKMGVGACSPLWVHTPQPIVKGTGK